MTFLMGGWLCHSDIASDRNVKISNMLHIFFFFLLLYFFSEINVIFIFIFIFSRFQVHHGMTSSALPYLWFFSFFCFGHVREMLTVDGMFWKLHLKAKENKFWFTTMILGHSVQEKDILHCCLWLDKQLLLRLFLDFFAVKLILCNWLV